MGSWGGCKFGVECLGLSLRVPCNRFRDVSRKSENCSKDSMNRMDDMMERIVNNKGGEISSAEKVSLEFPELWKRGICCQLLQ